MSVTQMSTQDAAIAAGGILGKLDGIHQLLADLLLDSEQEPDFDVTYLAGGASLAVDQVVPIVIPRTIRHAEVTLTVVNLTPANGLVAVFAGNVSVAQAQQQHKKDASALAGPSNAIVTQNGGSVTARDYLDGSGYITVYFLVTAADTIYANVRIRSLDAIQQRPQRT